MMIDQLMNPKTPTKAEINSAFALTLAVTEAIREAGQIPSGELYALLCGKLSLSAYESMINMLKRTGLVTESAHLLTWAGPSIDKNASEIL